MGLSETRGLWPWPSRARPRPPLCSGLAGGGPHTSPAHPACGPHSEPAPPEPRPPSPPPPVAPVAWLRPAAPSRVRRYITALPGHLLHQAPRAGLRLTARRGAAGARRGRPGSPFPPSETAASRLQVRARPLPRPGAAHSVAGRDAQGPAGPQEPTSTQVISPSEQGLFREQEGSFPGNGTRSRGIGKSSRSWCSEELSRVFWIQNWKRAALITN